MFVRVQKSAHVMYGVVAVRASSIWLHIKNSYSLLFFFFYMTIDHNHDTCMHLLLRTAQ